MLSPAKTAATKGRCHGNHFLAFYIWGAHWHHLANMTEPSVCSGNAALYQITLISYYSAKKLALPSIGKTLWRVSTMFALSAITPPEVNGFG